MSRVDVPKLECDRCKWQTQDLMEMGKFPRVEHPHMSGTDQWDLCPACWQSFLCFLAGDGL